MPAGNFDVWVLTGNMCFGPATKTAFSRLGQAQSRHRRLPLALRRMGFGVTVHAGFLDIRCAEAGESLEVSLEKIANWTPLPTDEVLPATANLMTEKFHPYLSLELLLEDVTSSRIDVNALPGLARRLIERRKGDQEHKRARNVVLPPTDKLVSGASPERTP